MKTRRIAIAIIGLGLCVRAWAQTTTFSGTLIVQPVWTHEKTAGSSTVSETFSELLRMTHTSGTNASQMSTVVVIAATLAASATNTHNLAGGVTNSFGDATTFVDARLLAFRSSSATNPVLALGNAATNTFSSWLGAASHTVRVAPGGLLLWTAPVAGWSCADGNLQVVNTGTNSATYQLYVGGAR